jgi:hypothetical protein
MKTKIFTILTLMALCLGFSSCKDDWSSEDVSQGQLSLSSMNVEVSNVEKVITSSRAAIDTDAFLITITNQSTGEVAGSYQFGTMPEVVSLPVGKYTLTVKSHNVQKAEWEHPYFEGSKDFEITNGKITDIGQVVCTFASLKVSIRFKDDLLNAIGDDAKVTVVANDGGKLEFTPTETRSGYFAVVEGSNTLVATFTGEINGTYASRTATYTDVEGGQHRIIYFDLKTNDALPPEEVGNITIGGDSEDESGTNSSWLDISTVTVDIITGNVTIDADESLDSSDRPGQETPDESDNNDNNNNNQGGSTTPTGNITFTSALSFTTPNTIDATDGKVYVHSDNGFSSFVVKIDGTDDFNNDLPSMGLPLQFDLANITDEELAATLSNPNGFNFPVNDSFKNTNDVTFDITNFIGLMGSFSGTQRFILNVTDNGGYQKSATLTFEIP